MCATFFSVRNYIQRWVMTNSSHHEPELKGPVSLLRLPICIRFEFLIMDSSPPVFTVIFDKTRLNDASLANDTWKNHLSVHYCFFRFLSD